MKEMNLYFNELPAEDQKEMQDGWMKRLPSVLRMCEHRLKLYANSDELSGGVTKLLTDIDISIDFLEEARAELIKRHKLDFFPRRYPTPTWRQVRLAGDS
jgi:hypothetical protein